MVMNMVRCPVCDKGTLRPGKVKESMFGVELGEYDGEICSKCGETFLDSDVTKKLEEKAKALGLWGISKKVKIVRSGNSLCIRIPAELARFLDLKEGKEIVIAPDGKEKLVVDLI